MPAAGKASIPEAEIQTQVLSEDKMAMEVNHPTGIPSVLLARTGTGNSAMAEVLLRMSAVVMLFQICRKVAVETSKTNQMLLVAVVITKEIWAQELVS